MINFNSTTYDRADVVGFMYTADQWGEFSNFSKHPVMYQGQKWKSSEALYQAARFPNHPEMIKMIFEAKTPKDAKLVARHGYELTRTDWDEFKVSWMHDVLALKLQSNAAIWRSIDLSGERPIVEISRRDEYWGAKPIKHELIGCNVLGKLWMLIRHNDLSYYYKEWQPILLPYLQTEPTSWIFPT